MRTKWFLLYSSLYFQRVPSNKHRVFFEWTLISLNKWNIHKKIKRPFRLFYMQRGHRNLRVFKCSLERNRQLACPVTQLWRCAKQITKRSRRNTAAATQLSSLSGISKPTFIILEQSSRNKHHLENMLPGCQWVTCCKRVWFSVSISFTWKEFLEKCKIFTLNKLVLL